ncbi:MAG: SDR family oxidoreductase [Methanomassiliicoccales archaeon]|nr:SDR family oxidoreductase [Methanomassiliicoccales archaeon]
MVLITGATSGIGRVTAKALAGMGARVVILGRDAKKGDELLNEIHGYVGERTAEFILCDMASLENVRKAALEFRSRFDRLDVLIDNAGGINGKRKVTADGFEYTFGVNHLAHFVLTNLLLDMLRASAPSRVVVTSSSAQAFGHIDFDDLMAERHYRSLRVYGRSKLANALFTFELARRLDGTGVTANCFHPGAVRSNFVKGMGGAARVMAPVVGIFERSPEKGAETQIYLASSPDVEGDTGRYFVKKKVRRSSNESLDPEVAKRLWEVSEELTNKWLD